MTGATRSQTLIEGIKRLNLAHDGVLSFHRTHMDGALTIHLVGADHREGNTPQETIQIFDKLLASISQHYNALHLVIVGPNVMQRLHRQSHSINHISLLVEVSYYVGTFEEYYEDNRVYTRPDLAVCFNAGVWGYDQWIPALKLLVHTIATPILITSYNSQEASDDEDILDESVQPPCWYWRPEKNPYGSKTPRSTQNDVGSVLYENDYWMCIGPFQS